MAYRRAVKLTSNLKEIETANLSKSRGNKIYPDTCRHWSFLNFSLLCVCFFFVCFSWEKVDKLNLCLATVLEII